MKKISILLLAFTLLFLSCDLKSPDRSEVSEIPEEMEGQWVGVIYNAKSSGWTLGALASAGAGFDLQDYSGAAASKTSVEDGILGVEITSDSIEFVELVNDIDGYIKSADRVLANGIRAELQSDMPDVGYMLTGDLELENFTMYDDGDIVSGYPVDSEIVSGTVHFPSYTDTSSIESALRDQIYDLLQDVAKSQSDITELISTYKGVVAAMALIPDAVALGLPGLDETLVNQMLLSALMGDMATVGAIQGGYGNPSQLSDITTALTDTITEEVTNPTVFALENDLRDEHKSIIDDYITIEDLFGYIDGSDEGGLDDTGTEQLRLVNLTWGYDSETGENEVDTIEILCNVANTDWLQESYIKLNSIGIGRYIAYLMGGEMPVDTAGDMLTEIVGGAFMDPRWTEVQDIDE
ncbi:MAG: hypothetical protein OCD02_15345 [Spirochaetaceae bacterium]